MIKSRELIPCECGMEREEQKWQLQHSNDVAEDLTSLACYFYSTDLNILALATLEFYLGQESYEWCVYWPSLTLLIG